MDFSQTIEKDEMFVELKYCERCGGLWLRPLNNDESYCDGCRAAMAALPGTGRCAIWFRKNQGRRRAFSLARGRRWGTGGNVGTLAYPSPRRRSDASSIVIETLLGIAELPGRSGNYGRISELREVPS